MWIQLYIDVHLMFESPKNLIIDVKLVNLLLFLGDWLHVLSCRLAVEGKVILSGTLKALLILINLFIYLSILRLLMLLFFADCM